MLPVQPSRMVLPREQIHLFLRGQRTLLLVPRRDERADRAPYPAGGKIALQPAASRPATCRVLVARVTDVALGELDDDQAHELGRRDLDELMAAWVAEHDLWNENARAWLMRVIVDTAARPRLLHRDSTKGSVEAGAGYTTSPHEALSDEPEAVDDVALAIARRAAERTERTRYERLLEARRAMPADLAHERLRMAMADARARGIDIVQDAEARKLLTLLGSFERKVYRPANRTADVA